MFKRHHRDAARLRALCPPPPISLASTHARTFSFLFSSLGNKKHLRFLLQTRKYPQLIPSVNKMTPATPQYLKVHTSRKLSAFFQITDLSALQRQHLQRRSPLGWHGARLAWRGDNTPSLSHNTQKQLGFICMFFLIVK